MGLFANVKTAKLMKKATYLGTGRYVLRVGKIVHKDPSKGTGTRKREEAIIIELAVLAVIPTNDSTPPAHRVGDEVCRFIKSTGNEYFDADIADFIMGISGCKQEEITEEAIEFALQSPTAPLTGTVVECDNKQITTKKGILFTTVHFVREVPPAEALKILPKEVVTKYFPANFLEARAAATASAGK